MRRAIVAGTATVSGVVLLLGLKPHGGGVAQAAGNFSIGSGTDPSSSSSSSASAPPTASTQAKPGSGSSSGSGSATKVVTGDAADTRYGPVQLQVTFQGKKIAKISVLQYPTESFRDQEINDYALPLLNQEAMTAQNSRIDVVSGATYTSDGYTQSLQSAIDKAGS